MQFSYTLDAHPHKRGNLCVSQPPHTVFDYLILKFDVVLIPDFLRLFERLSMACCFCVPGITRIVEKFVRRIDKTVLFLALEA